MKKKFVLLLILFFYPGLILAIDKVEINIASLSQLEVLAGIGEVKAQAIVDARPFSSVDDLLRVSGIGEKTLQKIKDQGLAYVTGSSLQDENITGAQNTVPTENTLTEPVSAPSEPKTTASYPSGIFINEILPNPEGSDETDEWVELYNSNNFEVDLSGWKIQDTVGTVKAYTIPMDTKILSYGFLFFKRPETKIMLNNDEDGIILSSPEKKIASSINYTKAPLGQSYNKTVGVWQWSLTLTPGAKNIIPAPKTLPSTKNSVKNENTADMPAGLSQSVALNQRNNILINPWFLFFTALSITIILAGTVLFIKLRFLDVTKP